MPEIEKCVSVVGEEVTPDPGLLGMPRQNCRT